MFSVKKTLEEHSVEPQSTSWLARHKKLVVAGGAGLGLLVSIVVIIFVAVSSQVAPISDQKLATVDGQKVSVGTVGSLHVSKTRIGGWVGYVQQHRVAFGIGVAVFLLVLTVAILVPVLMFQNSTTPHVEEQSQSQEPVEQESSALMWIGIVLAALLFIVLVVFGGHKVYKSKYPVAPSLPQDQPQPNPVLTPQLATTTVVSESPASSAPPIASDAPPSSSNLSSTKTKKLSPAEAKKKCAAIIKEENSLKGRLNSLSKEKLIIFIQNSLNIRELKIEISPELEKFLKEVSKADNRGSMIRYFDLKQTEEVREEIARVAEGYTKKQLLPIAINLWNAPEKHVRLNMDIVKFIYKDNTPVQ